jgi:two-component system, LytTR family, sensor kinase
MVNKRTTYWLCQLGGWLGMVLIELSNYTFFIFGKFRWEFVAQFGLSAFIGLLVTHAYRYFLIRIGYFQKNHKGIWLFGLVSTLLLALLITLLGYGTALFSQPREILDNIRLIDLVGQVYNWSRYVVVWIIIYFLYHLLQRNHAMEQEKLQMETSAKTAELELLKTQLNPHFLFNALNSIKALVSINPEVSRDAIVKLSELLRFTLQYNKEQEIPLQEELAEVEKYLELEILRFGERLQVLYKIPDTIKSALIPPAVLLTLAENAVKHGISQSAKPGEIIIEGSLHENQLLLTMKNTGVYAPGDRVGIGLLQIRRRLEELYKGKAVLTLENRDHYVVATLKIPQL